MLMILTEWTPGNEMIKGYESPENKSTECKQNQLTNGSDHYLFIVKISDGN